MNTGRPLNVAVVGACPYFVPQGSQVYLRETAGAFALAGCKVHLVVYGYGADVKDDGVTVHRAPNVFGARKTAAGPSFAKPFLDAALARTLRRVIREYAIDIIDAHNYEGLAVALRSGKRPIIYHPHNAMVDELPYYLGSWARAAGRRFDRALPKRADYVVAPHVALAGYLVTCGCRVECTTVIPPPIDVDTFAPVPIGKTTPPVLYAGNLDAYQNLRFMQDVMERVRLAVPGAEFLVATASPRAIPGARVVPTPNLDALRAVLSQDAVFVCPRVSWSGFPIKLLNAMAAGLPIVCSSSAAHPIRDGENGFVVSDNDPEAFALAVVGLLRDPKLRAILGRNARNAVEAHHHPETVANQLGAVITHLMSARRPILYDK